MGDQTQSQPGGFSPSGGLPPPGITGRLPGRGSVRPQMRRGGPPGAIGCAGYGGGAPPQIPRGGPPGAIGGVGYGTFPPPQMPSGGCAAPPSSKVIVPTITTCFVVVAMAISPESLAPRSYTPSA